MLNEPVQFPSCPHAVTTVDRILLGHGGGGQLTQDLLQKHIRRLYPDPAMEFHDSAVFVPSSARLAFTTDSFVVQPLFFPGGDIGSLSVYGTLNDLAMVGARPEYLSVAFIIEEGLPMETFDRILDSMRDASLRCGVSCMTGDTKVVERGKGDGLFINTSGIGALRPGIQIHPSRMEPGDAILVSGDLGRHGATIMSARTEGLLHLGIPSDLAPLYPLVEKLLDADLDLHCLRDLTRGGLAAALNELAQARGCGMVIEEDKIPVSRAVQACCDLLGLDPLTLANEGRFICILPEAQAEKAVRIMTEHADGREATRIGQVDDEPLSGVRLKTSWTSGRILPMPSGELLPRIC